MSKRKNLGVSNATVDPNEKCFWTTAMEDVLVDAYVHQHNLGNRQGGTFISKALDEILQEMRDRFPNKVLDKTKIKDRMKRLKSKFTPCYDLFKNGLSGFGWDPTTNMWTAEPDVWEKLIEAKPEAAMWRNKPIPYYDQFLTLYGQDRATGEYSENTSEMRRNQATMNETNNEEPLNNFDSIDDIDVLISNNAATLNNFDINNDEESGFSPGMHSQGPLQEGVSSKKKKGKAKTEDKSFEMFTNSIDTMVSALVKCSSDLAKSQADLAKSQADLVKSQADLVKSQADIAKSQTTRVMSDNEVWTMLEEMQLDTSILDKAYFFLIRDLDAQRAVHGCPPERRMRILTYLMSTNNISP